MYWLEVEAGLPKVPTVHKRENVGSLEHKYLCTNQPGRGAGHGKGKEKKRLLGWEGKKDLIRDVDVVEAVDVFFFFSFPFPFATGG